MVDYSKYSLSEIREAWESIDDMSSPDRACAIYRRLKDLEAEEARQDAVVPEWIRAVEKMLSPRRDILWHDDRELEQELELKEQRVRRLIHLHRQGDSRNRDQHH